MVYIMEQQSKTYEAKENTENLLKKMVVFEDNMTDELNTLAKQALFSAKMEVFMAELEKIDYKELSNLAQRVHENPDLILEKQFTLKELAENFTKPNNEQTTMDAFATPVSQDDIEIVETTENEPTKKRKRREWSIRQIIDIDGECEMKIEILRPRLRNPKEPVGDEIQVRI